MRKALFGPLFLAFLSISCFGQTDGWKRHRNAGGNFTALFPVDPQDSVNKNDKDIESHTLLAQQSPFVYTVIYTSMKSEQQVNDATYESFKNAVFNELPKCEVGAEAPPTPAIQGYIGHWYRLNCEMTPNKVTILGNLYWGKHYAYAVMVMYRSDVGEPAAGKSFLQSFAVLDESK
jgi:hypothetical protein